MTCEARGICHLRDVRRPLGASASGRTVYQVPVICAADIIEAQKGGDAYTGILMLVTCPDCLQVIEETAI